MSPFNGGITDISSNREHPSLFRPFHLVVQNCFLHQSFLDMLPPLLPKGKTEGECREATLSRFLLEIFMKYKIVLCGTGHYCLCTARWGGAIPVNPRHLPTTR